MTGPLSAEELHKRETDRLESRLWANDDGPSLAGYRQLAFDAISLLKDSTYAAIEAEATAAAEQRLAGLREAIETLPGTNEEGISAPGQELLDRAAVLALLDSPEKP